MQTLDIISPLPPFPPYAGGTAHIFQSSRQLGRYFNTALYTLAVDPSTVEWGPMREWCSDLRAFPHAAIVQRSAFGAQRYLDPPAVHHDWSPTLAAFLHERWLSSPPDIVQFEFTTMAQYAPIARTAGALVVCTAHNVAFLAQMRRARQEQHLRIRLRRLIGALSLWQYELRTLRQCHVVVVHGVSDGEALRRWLPSVPVVYVPSGIDLEQWLPGNSFLNSNEVLFVGNYSHPPNVEGALWLVHEVWPLVRRVWPNARLTLAGRAPPNELLALAAGDISIPGTVEDLQPFYRNSSVVVAPIFWGSGVRVKLIEALASALPVVTTPLAAEGMNLIHEHNALIATSAEDFAVAIVKLLSNSKLRRAIGLQGRQVVEQSYDWRPIARQLAGLYQGIGNK